MLGWTREKRADGKFRYYFESPGKTIYLSLNGKIWWLHIEFGRVLSITFWEKHR